MGVWCRMAAVMLLGWAMGGCASVVNMNVKHAPEIDLGAVRTLAVEKFSVSGQVNLNTANGKDIWGNMIKNAVVSSMAAPSEESLRERHYAGLVQALLGNGYFQVSQGAGDASLSGHVEYKVNDGMSELESKNANSGKSKKTYTLRRTTTVVVDFQVTDSKGRVLGAAQVRHEDEKKWEDDSEEDVRNRAQRLSVTDYVEEAMAATQAGLVGKIAPHFVMESRTLEESDSEQIKKGNKAAEEGDWANAAKRWQSMMNSSDAADRSAALYNLAVYDEAEGRLEAALAKYEKVADMTHKAKFSAEVERMRARIQGELRMKQNEEKRKQGGQP